MAFEYFFPFFLMILGALWQFFDYRKLNFLFYFLLVYLSLLAGFRDRVGPDWPGYEAVFFTFKENINVPVDFLVELYGMERAYLLFNKIIAGLGFELWVFYLVFATIAIYLKFWVINKHAKYTFLALSLYYIPYFFFDEIIQIRQGFAIALVFFSFKYVIERNLARFLLFIFIAANFHISALIFISGYYIYSVKIPKILMLILLFISLGLSQINILSYFAPILRLSSSISYSMLKGLSYINEYNEALEFSFGDVSRFLFVLILVYFKDFLTEKDKIFNGLINYVFLGSVLFFTFKTEPIFSTRLTSHFIAFSYIAFPRMLYYLKVNRMYFNMVYLGLLLYSVLLYQRYIYINGESLKEYDNIIYNPSKLSN